jgi:hypothetical protein
VSTTFHEYPFWFGGIILLTWLTKTYGIERKLVPNSSSISSNSILFTYKKIML